MERKSILKKTFSNIPDTTSLLPLWGTHLIHRKVNRTSIVFFNYKYTFMSSMKGVFNYCAHCFFILTYTSFSIISLHFSIQYLSSRRRSMLYGNERFIIQLCFISGVKRYKFASFKLYKCYPLAFPYYTPALSLFIEPI